MKGLPEDQDIELLIARYLEGEVGKEALEPLLQQYPELQAELEQLESLEARLQTLPKPDLSAYEPFFDRVEAQLKGYLQQQAAPSSTSAVGSRVIRGGSVLPKYWIVLLGVVAVSVGIALFLRSQKATLSPQREQILPRYVDSAELVWELPAEVTQPVQDSGRKAHNRSNREEQVAGTLLTQQRVDTARLRGIARITTPVSPVSQQIEHLRQQLEAARQQGADIATILVLERQLGILYRQQGDLQQSRQWLERAVEEADDAGLVVQKALAQGELALTLHAMGKEGESIRMLQHVTRVLRAQRHPAYQRWLQMLQRITSAQQ